jgi:Tfp pilus assembly protein PilN
MEVEYVLSLVNNNKATGWATFVFVRELTSRQQPGIHLEADLQSATHLHHNVISVKSEPIAMKLRLTGISQLSSDKAVQRRRGVKRS